MPEQLEVIFLGTDDDFNTFLDSLRKKLRVDDDNSISDTNSQYSLTW